MGGRVARGAFKSIMVAGSGAGVSFLVQIVLGRLLGTEAYGVYLLALGWLSVAQVAGKLEVDVISVRFVGSYVATARWGLLKGYLRSSRRAVVLASVIVALVMGAIVLGLEGTLAAKHPDYQRTLLAACLLLPFLAVLVVEGATLQGFHQYARSQVPLNLVRPLAFGVTVAIIAVLWPQNLSAPSAIGANLVGVVLALALVSYWRRRATPAEAKAATAEHDTATWVRTAYPLFAVTIAQVIISQQADVLVVGTYLDAAQAGIYGAASQLTLPLTMAVASVTFVAQPMISDLYSRNESRRLQTLIRVVTWASAALAVPIAAMLIFAGPWLLSLWGDDFRAGHSVLIILTLAQLVIGLAGDLAGYMLTMTAHERAAAWIIGGSALVNIALALILTPLFGPIGTASATLVAATARAASLSIYIRRSMGFRLPSL